MDVLTRHRRLVSVAVVLATAAATALGPDPAARASAWTVGLAPASRGQAATRALPTAPTGVTATCSLVALAITVAWNAVPTASSYTVWQSTSGASGPFTVAASGVTATTWASPVLQVGTYWYSVTAVTGTAWTSPSSAVTASRTIAALVCL